MYAFQRLAMKHRNMKQINGKACKHCGDSMLGKRCDAEFCSKNCRHNAGKRRRRLANGSFVVGGVRSCALCGQSFSPRRPKHIFCTDRCARIHYEDRTKTKRIVNCKVCKSSFQPNSSMHVICSEKCIASNQRDIRIAKKYGLSAEAFRSLLNAQGGKCAICGSSEKLVVDHNHSCCQNNQTCGKCVRGILCFHCNVAIGLLKDSPQIIGQALKYISNTIGQLGGQRAVRSAGAGSNDSGQNSNDSGQKGSVYE